MEILPVLGVIVVCTEHSVSGCLVGLAEGKRQARHGSLINSDSCALVAVVVVASRGGVMGHHFKRHWHEC